MVDETGEESWRHEGKRIEDEIEIQADPGTVWAAWAEPDELARWFVDQASGTAEPGGEMTWCWEAYEIEQTLEVVEAEAGRRLVLKTAWGGSSPKILEVTCQPTELGTRVRLVHSGFLEEEPGWEDEYEGAKSGWTNALAHLKVQLEAYSGRDRSTLDLLKPAAYTVDQVLEATRTPEGLGAWLGKAQAPLASVGDPVAIDLAAGGRLTGRVVALTGWETALTWREVEGVVTFQAFPGEQGERMVGLRVTSWSDQAEALLEEQRSGLEAALEHLAHVLGDT